MLAHDRYLTPNGKTAHGLVRGSDRFDVRAVVDPAATGRDAGEALDGRHRGIPIVTSLSEAVSHAAPPANPGTTIGNRTGAQQHQPELWAVIGVATHGGRLEPAIRMPVLEAVRAGISVVNGLHDALIDDAEIAAAAASNNAHLVDLRRPRPHSELHFWEGEIYQVRAPRIAVLGTDCALGKRTTTRMLVESLNAAGTRAEMIYTGQTGWMQGARFGFIFDSTLNDYVSGEMEHAILACDREANPEAIVIEGQSALRNPSGPCGAEMLLSAATRGVVLQHAAGRDYFEGYEQLGLRLPDLADEMALIAAYGARTLAVTLNGSGIIDPGALEQYRAEQEARLGIPVVCVLEQGLDRVTAAVQRYLLDESPPP